MKKDLPLLTVARFFAAIWVVWFHYGRFVPMGPIAKNLTSFGHVGVTFFFVLSGFILTYVARPIETREFYRRRFARIFPMYFVGWLLFGVWFALQATSASYLVKSTVVFGGLSLALVQAWVPFASQFWNTPGWSLSCEAFFYACFPWLYESSKRTNLKACAVMLCIGCAMYAALVQYADAVTMLNGTPLATTWGAYLHMLPLLQILPFMLGIVIGRLFVSGVSLPYPRVTLAMCIGAIALLAAFNAGTWALAAIFAVLIYALAAIRTHSRFSAGVMLGNASYGIYILQEPMWNLFCYVRGVSPWGREASPIEVLAFCALLTALCVALYVVLEKPAEKWLRTKKAIPIPAPVVIYPHSHKEMS